MKRSKWRKSALKFYDSVKGEAKKVNCVCISLSRLQIMHQLVPMVTDSVITILVKKQVPFKNSILQQQAKLSSLDYTVPFTKEEACV